MFRQCFVFALFLFATSICSAGGDNELTPHAGLRFGGEVDAGIIDVGSLDDRPAFGLTYDRSLSPQTGWWTAWSFQRTEFDAPELLPDRETIDLDVHYLHVGGTYHPKDRARARAFVIVGLGLTWVDPRPAEFDSGIGASILVGGGFRAPLKPKIALRLDIRGYATLVESEIAGRCGGTGCTIDFAGSGGFQIDVLGGVVLRVLKYGPREILHTFMEEMAMSRLLAAGAVLCLVLTSGCNTHATGRRGAFEGRLVDQGQLHRCLQLRTLMPVSLRI